MNSVYFTLCVLALVSLNSVRSKEICDLANIECVTKGSQNAFKVMAHGVEGVVQSSDPLVIAKTEGELHGWKYRLSNITLTGLENCQLIQLVLNDENLSFQKEFVCPELVQHYNHDIKGLLGPVVTDGQGTTTVTYNDYKLTLKGKYRKFISEKDNKLHLSVESHEAEFEPKDVKIDLEGPLHSDESKSDIAKAYVQDNLKDMEILLRTLTMKSFMEILMSNFDKYLRAVPLEDVLPAEN